MRILLLEDDLDLSSTIKEFLESNDYKVDLARTFDKAIDLSYENHYDLYLFDINLPKDNGLNLASMLKQSDDNTPVIFITALVDIDTISKAFDIGAVDYIKKPFFPEELLLRIESRFAQPQIISYKNIIIDTKEDILQVDNQIIDIGHNQYIILKELLKNIGSAVKKEELMELLDTPSEVGLRVTLNRIKKRLGIEIKNVRNKGYLIEKI